MNKSRRVMGQQTPPTQFGPKQAEVIARTIEKFKDKVGFDSSNSLHVEFFANLEIDLAHSMKVDPKKFAYSCMPTKQRMRARGALLDLDAMTQQLIKTRNMLGTSGWMSLESLADEDETDNYDDVPF